MNRLSKLVTAGLAAVVILVGAVAAWRLAAQKTNLVIVNQSGIEARLTWQPSLFAQLATVTVGACESKSTVLLGGESWRLEADGLDMNDRFVDRPWFTPMVELEIWLDPGGSSRIVGPRAVDQPVAAPMPSGCFVVP